MREILFRGKRIDNGDWVYGFFWKDIWGDGESCYILFDNEDFPVIPETVGQYTGLKDKNGKKIFESDIVEFTTVECEVIFNPFVIKNMSHKGYIFYQYGAFYVKVDDSNADYELHGLMDLEQDQSLVEVIGNIYDNPELIKNFK